MADNGAKVRDLGRMVLLLGDVVAFIGLCIIVGSCFWPLWSGIGLAITGHRPGAFPIPMASLGVIGVTWLVRRHGERVLSFYALVMSSTDEHAAIESRTQSLFAILDVGSWLSVTVVAAASVWLLVGSPVYLPSNTLEPAQMLLANAFALPALIGGMWLLMRSKFVRTIYPKRYRDILEELARKRGLIPPSTSR